MRILITGAGGQLARSLQAALAEHDLRALSRADLDVTNGAEVSTAVDDHHSQAAIHCAALTDTNRCEREPSAAEAVNAAGSENVARACAAAGARLVAISTNEVFDGTASVPYTEDHAVGPLNGYARSKVEGETRARSACRDTLIVRTSWLYGAGGNNFVEKVRSAAASGRPLSFVTDEVATPTATDDLAVAIRQLLDFEAPAGVYHLANEGAASRYEWALKILALSGSGQLTVTALSTEQLRAAGYDGPRKPAYSVLANTRAAALGVSLRPWEQALAAYLRCNPTTKTDG